MTLEIWNKRQKPYAKQFQASDFMFKAQANMDKAEGSKVAAIGVDSPSLMPRTPRGVYNSQRNMAEQSKSPVTLVSNDDNDEDTENGGSSLDGESKEARRPRLTQQQVQFLENSFLEDNKLDTERKERLAQHLGLKPRQVSIWFQNRRTRWKTKKMENDFDGLKADFDTLMAEFTAVQKDYDLLKCDYKDLLEDNTQLCAEIDRLNLRIGDVSGIQSSEGPAAVRSPLNKAHVPMAPPIYCTPPRQLANSHSTSTDLSSSLGTTGFYRNDEPVASDRRPPTSRANLFGPTRRGSPPASLQLTSGGSNDNRGQRATREVPELLELPEARLRSSYHEGSQDQRPESIADLFPDEPNDKATPMSDFLSDSWWEKMNS